MGGHNGRTGGPLGGRVDHWADTLGGRVDTLGGRGGPLGGWGL